LSFYLIFIWQHAPEEKLNPRLEHFFFFEFGLWSLAVSKKTKIIFDLILILSLDILAFQKKKKTTPRNPHCV